MNNYITDSIIINLSSSSAIKNNGSMNSNLLFKTNGIYKDDKHILYSQIGVSNAQIPISYYQVNTTNNIFSFTLKNSNYSVTLTSGNYNANTFINMITSLIVSYNFSLSINATTGKFILSNTTEDFIILPNSTCYHLLGFPQNQNVYSSSKSLTFPYPCNLYGINRIKIKSNILATRNFDSNSGQGNILSTIPVSSGLTGVLCYVNYSNFKNIINNKNLDYIDILVTDENDNFIDFNGIDIFLTLQLDIIREYQQTKEDLLSLLSPNTTDLEVLNKIKQMS